jgi:2-hydroxymuconate-semialdehyde hydrolase
VTVPQHRFVTSGGEMAYFDEGNGAAVVLLHGFPSSSFLWREFIPLLAGRFRVIVPDLLGAGDSAQPESAPLHIRAQAGYVRELLTHLGVERFAVVGHGVGGGIAQLMALDAPGVDAMVLLDSIAFDRWPSEAAHEAQARADDSGGLLMPELVEAAIRTVYDLGLRHRERVTEAVLEEYVRPYRGPAGAAGFARGLAAMDGVGLTGREDDLARIGFPVLILWGEDDVFFPATLGERLNEAMPSSTLGLLPGCGHFLPEEVPETIGPMLAEYLRARYLMEPHGHDQKEGVVMLQLERRPPWVDLAADEADDWYVEDDEED